MVGIIMGSRSDWDVMQHAVTMLDQLGITHEVEVVSAHRTPDKLFAYADVVGGAWLEGHHCGSRWGGPFTGDVCGQDEAACAGCADRVVSRRCCVGSMRCCRSCRCLRGCPWRPLRLVRRERSTRLFLQRRCLRSTDATIDSALSVYRREADSGCA